MKRSRILYLALLFVAILAGLGSRRYAAHLPRFVSEYAGDTLWALAGFVGLGLVFSRWSSSRAAVVAAGFGLAVELSQLSHATWLQALRATRLGGLMLGYGFLWSDLLCYAVGILLGLTVEVCWQRRTATGRSLP